jgi:hypothetical protein
LRMLGRLFAWFDGFLLNPSDCSLQLK